MPAQSALTDTVETVAIRFPARPAPDRRRLGELLVERGLIRYADLTNGLALQQQNGGLIGLNLVRLGAISEAQLLEVVSEQLDLPILLAEEGPRPDQVAGFLAEIRSPLSWWAEAEAVAWRDDETGRILLADEIHTPDSSRYWIASGYEAALRDGTRPPSFDKDVIRSWVVSRCDPYRDPIPEIPAEMIARTAQVYIDAYEAITGQTFVPDTTGETPLDRVRANLAPWFTA